MIDYLGSVGLILLSLVLIIIIVPLMLGIGVSTIFELTGYSYYIAMIIVAIICWTIFSIVWWY